MWGIIPIGASPSTATIADGTVTTAKLATNCLSADATGRTKMADGFLTTAKMDASAVTNAVVSATAAIAYSKLNLATSIVNADVAVGAAIAYSKLALAVSIVNADIAAGAAIAYSKLNLAASIVAADIAALAVTQPKIQAVACRGKKDATQTLVSGTPTAITFDGADLYDTSAIHDPTVSNSRFTVPNAGLYLVTAQMRWSPSTLGIRAISVRKNNTGTDLGYREEDGSSNYNYQTLALQLQLAASDYIELFGLQKSGTDREVSGDTAGAVDDTRLEIVQLGTI